MMNPRSDDEEDEDQWWAPVWRGIDNYPAHIPMGLPLPDRDDRPDEEYSL